MPFDGTNFPNSRDEEKRPASGGTLAAVLIIAISTILLITPISLAALADIVHALSGR